MGHTVTLERDGKSRFRGGGDRLRHPVRADIYVATLPEYEGQGYGRAVVYHCAGWLLEKEPHPSGGL